MKITPEILQRMLELDETIQQIPSPTFAETQRSAFICQQFAGLGLACVEQDEIGNVYGCLPGGSQPPAVVSAHLDTVFSASADLHLRRTPGRIAGPGIGDNALGLAGLIVLVWVLRENQVSLPGDLWLAANTCEEGLGNLNGMRAVVDRFGLDPVVFRGGVGIGLGNIFHRGTAVERYRIQVRTPGGHPWIASGAPSAVHEIARLITGLADLPLPDTPRTTLNVGLVSGGTTINTIASQAVLELDLRSEQSVVLAGLVAQVKTLLQQANQPEVHVDAELIGVRPSGEIPAGHRLVRLAEQCLLEQGIAPQLGCSSTDANLPLSRGLPALCLSLTRGNGAHTLDEPLAPGMAQLAGFISRAWPA
jgi:tripeptide aminopeptidase